VTFNAEAWFSQATFNGQAWLAAFNSVALPTHYGQSD
jgi:hypothetical protein